MNAELLSELGIDLKRKTSGSLKTVCPKCSDTRKSKKDPCLSVDIDEGVYNCHHCDFHGRVFEKKMKEYVKPIARLEKMNKKVIDWFEQERKISNNTLLRMGITEAKEWMPQFEKEVPVICFNYLRDEELVNIKFRGPQKSFKMAKDAELIFYNISSVVDQDSAIIVEGEIDCLTMVECGIYNSISVPNGASKGTQKLDYLDNCWEYFNALKKVIIATDEDEPGRSLKEELARRIGKEKCWIIEYPKDCKDANEVLLKYGKPAVTHMVENARQWPLEGIIAMDDIFPTVDEWYSEGYPQGVKAGIPGFDQMLRFAPGYITTITGIPGHGKDEFFNWVLTGLVRNERWKFGICGFEETPQETTSKLAEKLTGKAFDFRKNKEDRMSRQQFDWAISIIDQFFHFFNTEEAETSIEGILQLAKQLVLRFGIHGLYINPWNWIEHNRAESMSETEYVSQVYTKIIRFARKFGVHVFLVAHTTKMQKDKQTKKYEVPTLYNISGSANFYNKTHNGVTIYRNYDTGLIDVYFQKIKQSWMGQIGFSTYQFNTMTRQYSFVNSSVPDDQIKLPAELGDGSWRPYAEN